VWTTPCRPAKKGGKKVKVAVAKAATLRGQAPPPAAPAARGDYKCRVEVTRNGRGGKTVTIVVGLELLAKEEQKTLLKKIKNAVAGGGKSRSSARTSTPPPSPYTLRPTP